MRAALTEYVMVAICCAIDFVPAFRIYPVIANDAMADGCRTGEQCRVPRSCFRRSITEESVAKDDTIVEEETESARPESGQVLLGHIAAQLIDNDEEHQRWPGLFAPHRLGSDEKARGSQHAKECGFHSADASPATLALDSMFVVLLGVMQNYPTHTLALRQIRIHGPSSPQSSGHQECCNVL